MELQKNMVVAALAGVLVGVLMGAGAVQFALFTAQGIPPSYAKTLRGPRDFGSDDLQWFLNYPERRQAQGLESFKGSAPAVSDCDQFSGQRYTRCKIAKEEGIEYQPQDYRKR